MTPDDAKAAYDAYLDAIMRARIIWNEALDAAAKAHQEAIDAAGRVMDDANRAATEAYEQAMAGLAVVIPPDAKPIGEATSSSAGHRYQLDHAIAGLAVVIPPDAKPIGEATSSSAGHRYTQGYTNGGCAHADADNVACGRAMAHPIHSEHVAITSGDWRDA